MGVGGDCFATMLRVQQTGTREHTHTPRTIIIRGGEGEKRENLDTLGCKHEWGTYIQAQGTILWTKKRIERKCWPRDGVV